MAATRRTVRADRDGVRGTPCRAEARPRTPEPATRVPERRAVEMVPRRTREPLHVAPTREQQEAATVAATPAAERRTARDAHRDSGSASRAQPADQIAAAQSRSARIERRPPAVWPHAGEQRPPK